MTLITGRPTFARLATRPSSMTFASGWTTAANHSRAQLWQLLIDLGLSAASIGVEYGTHGLTAANGRALDAALADIVRLVDRTNLRGYVRWKSPKEIDYCRQGRGLADEALHAGMGDRRRRRRGRFLAAMQAAVLRGGGDYPGNEFIIGSGPDALLCRYKSGRRGPSRPRPGYTRIRRRLAALSCRPDAHRPCRWGEAPTSRARWRRGRGAGGGRGGHVSREDLCRRFRSPRPDHGRPAWLPHRLNACGYSLGARFTPTWMDWPMFYRGNRTESSPT